MPLWNTPGTKIASVKGFVHGINWDDPTNREARRDLLRKIKNYDTNYWDGDLWNPGSMTDVIKEAMDIYDDKFWVVSIKEKDVHKLAPEFVKTDKYGNELRGYPKGGNIYPLIFSNDVDWRTLGIEGMKGVTKDGAKVDIFYLGRGEVATVENEYFEKNMADTVTTKKHYQIQR